MRQTNDEAATLALGALAWIVGDTTRAERFLALTGITPDMLRDGAADPRFLAQVLAYLEGHEPDLIACADAIEVTPESLVAARRTLGDA